MQTTQPVKCKEHSSSQPCDSLPGITCFFDRLSDAHISDISVPLLSHNSSANGILCNVPDSTFDPDVTSIAATDDESLSFDAPDLEFLHENIGDGTLSARCSSTPELSENVLFEHPDIPEISEIHKELNISGSYSVLPNNDEVEITYPLQEDECDVSSKISPNSDLNDESMEYDRQMLIQISDDLIAMIQDSPSQAEENYNIDKAMILESFMEKANIADLPVNTAVLPSTSSSRCISQSFNDLLKHIPGNRTDLKRKIMDFEKAGQTVIIDLRSGRAEENYNIESNPVQSGDVLLPEMVNSLKVSDMEKEPPVKEAKIVDLPINSIVLPSTPSLEFVPQSLSDILKCIPGDQSDLKKRIMDLEKAGPCIIVDLRNGKFSQYEVNKYPQSDLNDAESKDISLLSKQCDNVDLDVDVDEDYEKSSDISSNYDVLDKVAMELDHEQQVASSLVMSIAEGASLKTNSPTPPPPVSSEAQDSFAGQSLKKTLTAAPMHCVSDIDDVKPQIVNGKGNGQLMVQMPLEVFQNWYEVIQQNQRQGEESSSNEPVAMESVTDEDAESVNSQLNKSQLLQLQRYLTEQMEETGVVQGSDEENVAGASTNVISIWPEAVVPKKEPKFESITPPDSPAPPTVFPMAVPVTAAAEILPIARSAPGMIRKRPFIKMSSSGIANIRPAAIAGRLSNGFRPISVDNEEELEATRATGGASPSLLTRPTLGVKPKRMRTSKPRPSDRDPETMIKRLQDEVPIIFAHAHKIVHHYLINLLQHRQCFAYDLVQWEDRDTLQFYVSGPKVVARIWALLKKNNNDDWENFARGIRNSRQRGYFSDTGTTRKKVFRLSQKAVLDFQRLSGIVPQFYRPPGNQCHWRRTYAEPQLPGDVLEEARLTRALLAQDDERDSQAIAMTVKVERNDDTSYQ